MASVGAMMAAAAPYLLGAMAGTQVLSGVMGMVGANQEGAATAEAFERQGDAAMAQAKNQAAQERDKYRRLASSQRASMGASGVDVGSGSFLDVLADTDAEGEVSAMQLLYGGKLEKWSAKSRAGQAKAQARRQGVSSLIGGITGGLSTGLMGMNALGLLSGGASPLSPGGAGGAPGVRFMGDMWRQYGK